MPGSGTTTWLLVNDTLSHVFAAEGRWLAHWRLPIGVSLVCLAERRA